MLGLPTPVYRYDKTAEQWKEVPPDAVAAETVQTDRLVVVSFNVLFDLYHGLTDLIHTHKRTPHALDMLRELDADIIGLQVRAARANPNAALSGAQPSFVSVFRR